MGFAQEIRDFTSAFTAVSNALGTRSSREAQLLDNEYRRATIDWTKARTAEIVGPKFEFGDFLKTLGGGMTPLDRSVDEGPPASTAASIAAATSPSSVTPPYDDGTPNPPARPVATVAKTAALTDDDLLSSASGSALTAGNRGADTLAQRDYDVRIKDRTSWRGMQPRALKIMDTINGTAQQMGIRLVVTAGAGGGHRSHSAGTEVDLIGYHADGSQWTPKERAMIAASGGRAGANRFGLYPGGSLHIGYAGSSRPSAVWGANGIVKGDAARRFRNPADQAFLKAFQSGQLYGGGGADTLIGGIAGDGFPEDTGGDIALDTYIARAAQARGIDPKIALRVARSEGLGEGIWQSNVVKNGRRETSYGPFQLLVGGGLGDEFIAKGYGDPSDPRTVYRQIDFALDKAAENGWGAWYGAAKVGVGERTGLDGARAIGVSAPLGSGDYAGGGGGSVGADRLTGGGVDDEFVPAYPEARTKDDELPTEPASAAEPISPAEPISSTASPSASMQGQDLVHDVAPGDTLWALSKRYNLDSYMEIVKANPQIVNPDLIYPEQNLVIPGGAQQADVPNPPTRPTGAVDAEPAVETEPNPMASSTADTMAVPTPPARPTTSYTPYDNPPGEVRPAGGLGALPPDSYTPNSEEPQAELKRAMDRREQLAKDTTQPPEVKQALLQALDIKIQQLSYDVGGTGSYTPTETVRPVAARPAAFPGQNTFRAATEVAPGMLSPTYPAGAGGARPDPTRRGAVGDDDLAGGAGTDMLAGGAAVDKMSPAETSIREVTDAWDITPTGHIMRPDGREAPDDTFTAGRKAALVGRNWLAKTIFGEGADAVDIEEDATPDDDMPDAASAYLSGMGALGQSQVAQTQQVIRAWAAKNDIELTESELNMRTLGALYSFYLMRDPEKAEAIAGSFMQYNQLKYNQYSAIAKAAVNAGDPDKAVEAAVRAYAEIPDGRDFQVTGDARSGYVVRYTDEETGKVISEKVLTPQEMAGMIMNMSPGDVDKFLVKAAGEDELPEASPQLTKLLADLEATPPDQRPKLDALGVAELDSQETQIYYHAIAAAESEWTARTGGVEGQQREADIEKVLGPTPPAAGAAPAAPLETPAATPATPATAEPAGAPAPTAAVAPTTGTPATGGAVGDNTLVGSDKLTSGSKELAPGIYAPGDDATFGLGPPPRADLALLASLKTQFGLELAKVKLDQMSNDYERELGMRKTAWQNWRLTHPAGAVEETPQLEGAGPPETMEGGWLGDASPLAKLQQEMPFIAPAIAPVLQNPGPDQNNYGVGPKPYADPASKLNQSEGNIRYIEDNERIAQEKWAADLEVAKQKYTDELAATTPTKRTLGKDELDNLDEDVKEYVTTYTEADSPEAKQLTTYEFLVQDAAKTLAETNNLTLPSAIAKVSEMILVDPDQPSLPNWRAMPHPVNPGVMLVQPLEGGRPSGQLLHVPTSIFHPLAEAWQQDANRVIGTDAEQYAKKAFAGELPATREEAIAEETRPGVVSLIGSNLATGALDILDRVVQGPNKTGGAIEENLGDLEDWLNRVTRGYSWDSGRMSPEEYKRRHPVAPPT